MFIRRFIQTLVVLGWLASLTWLITTKVIPSYWPHPERGYHDVLTEHSDADERASWRVRWNDQDIGQAEYWLQRHADGSSTILSVVEFRKLPVANVVESVMGLMVRLLPQQVRDDMHLELDAVVRTSMTFDPYNRLVDLESEAGLNEDAPLLYVRGTNANGTMRISTRLADSGGGPANVSYATEVPLAPTGFHIDSLTPLPQMRKLYVGQVWHERTLRPLATSAQWETTRAEVKARERIVWNGEEHRAYRVEYQVEGAGSLSVAHRPVGQMWVLRDGRVIRQELRLSSARIQFERLPEPTELPADRLPGSVSVPADQPASGPRFLPP